MKRKTILIASSLCLMGVCAWIVRAQQSAEQTLKGLVAAPGLEVKLWAAEPMFSNPTNMAIDERGRIWVAEGMNYRRTTGNRNLPDIRPGGDRIVILTDNDGDGKADNTKVFDQNPEIRSPLGIAVFGDKVYVSQSPGMTVYTKDADDRIVKKETFLTGFGGVDHDHGLHAMVFGPDGRFYFNNGNTGFDITDKSGRTFKASNYEAQEQKYDGGYYFMGTTMAINQDGTGLQVIAQNFRNPYEVAVDAFGNLWQTDNDDDGNAWTRANYIFQGGNYGFRGPLGRAWNVDNGTHFHNELPGVVPNLARLGAGSPCGLAIYEGKLLPLKYRGNMLHAEAGRRMLGSYLISNDGAGYGVKVEDALHGEDSWFRPSDVAVAPDGAVYVADWYDPSVGGHGMGDVQGNAGRIYRLAPPGHKTVIPALNLETPQGLTAALGSPNQSVFFLAHTKLKSQGRAALPELQAAWRQPDPVLKARSLWLLGGIEPEGKKVAQSALLSPDPKFRVLGLRVLNFYGADILAVSQPLLRDVSPQVRREIALMLQDSSKMTPAYEVGEQTTPSPQLLNTLVELVKQYDGKDRWYLEALGIAARGREDSLFARLRTVYPVWNANLAQILWEIRPPAALSYLTATMNNKALTVTARTQALNALSNYPDAAAASAVETLLLANGNPPALDQKAFASYRHQLYSLWIASRQSANFAPIMKRALATPGMQATALELVDALGDPQYVPAAMALSKAPAADEAVRAAALNFVARARDASYLPDFEAMAKATGPSSVRLSAVRAMGTLNPPGVEQKANEILLSTAPNEARAEAVRILMRSPAGYGMVLDLAEKGEFPNEFKNLVTTLVNAPAGGGRGARGAAPLGVQAGGRGAPGARGGPVQDPAVAAAMAALRERGVKLFPPLVTMNNATIPSVTALERNYFGVAAEGRKVFESDAVKCSACHSIGGPKKVGPDLSAIGSKLGKQAIIDAIATPSEAISHDFIAHIFETKNNGTVVGMIEQESGSRLVIRTDTGEELRLAASDIVSRRESKLSLMPDDLIPKMTMQQFAHLLEFLSAQKK